MARKWADKGSRHSRGYGSAWDRTRKLVLKRDSYLCQECMRQGRYTAAREVHHIRAKAHGGTDEMGNLISICRDCHEDASREQFGYRKKPRIGVDGFPVD